MQFKLNQKKHAMALQTFTRVNNAFYTSTCIEMKQHKKCFTEAIFH